MRQLFHLPRSLGGILLVLLSFSSLEAQTNTTVRVMSANLNGNTQSYQPFAIRIFQGLKPDIVAIQEFNYTSTNGVDANTPAAFREMVDTAFGTNFVYFRENFTGSGDIPNGIISRYPIVASGSWADTVQTQPNRGYAWAQIQLPGTNTVYIVSVHLLTSSSAVRASEATNLKALMQANFSSNSWVVLAGDFNTGSRSEAAMVTFDSFLSDSPIPVDDVGNSDTSANRNSPHDYVLPSFSFTNNLATVLYPNHSYPNGLVFDSRVYSPAGLADFTPVQSGDSGLAQHMAVLKDFGVGPVNSNTPPAITLEPQSQTVVQGNNANFTVTATGSPTLTYQWLLSGTNIGGATSSSYSRTNVQPPDAGPYSVLITNNSGSITSSPAILTVTNPPPSIITPPQSQTVAAGQNAPFTVTASGASLTYQWRFNSTNIPTATSSAYTVTNVQPSDAGPYLVVASNPAGSVTSSVATLTVQTMPSAVIAQWNFNSSPADGNTGTGTIAPSAGSGTASLVGGVSQAFFAGSSTDPAPSADNSGWSTMTYPAQGTANKTAGVRFNVSTSGRQNISIRWDHRVSNTGSKYAHLQYSTNGTTFADFPTATVVGVATAFEARTNSLASLPGVNDNPNFAFRIVAEFESTAITNANGNYVGANGTYAPGGTVRFDMVTVSGTTIAASNPPPSAATLGAPIYNSSQFQFTVTGSAGSNYVVQASTTLSAPDWLSLRTNASPFIFTDTNANSYTQRFYRALTSP